MKKMIRMIAVLILVASSAFAQATYTPKVSTFNADGKSPVFRVKNSGNETVTITVASGADSIVVTNGTIVTTIVPGTGYTTVSQLAAAIEAATNSAGVRTLMVDYGCSLAADTWTGVVTAAQTTISPNNRKWVDGPTWITASNKFFNAYYPAFNKGGIGNAKEVRKIHGNIGGTGNITIKGYVDGTVVFDKIIVSPIYVNSTTNGGLNASDEVGVACFDIPVNIPVGQSEGVMFRATRATTGTTGGIGLVLDVLP